MTHSLGMDAPALLGTVPGPASLALVERLSRAACPALTARRARRSEQSGASEDPIAWTRARGCNVWDADGNRFVDLTAGFGVAAVGHAHPAVVAALAAQSERLIHGLGDLHPSDVKVDLLEKLATLAPNGPARVMLGLSGSDAIEAALKTALLATSRPGVLAFEGAYHGLAHGPLAACGYKTSFRAPFAAQLNPHVTFVPFPRTSQAADHMLGLARTALASGTIGAVLIEPLLGRGGVVPPAPGSLAALAALARELGALVIADEVFTGLGRTGTRFRADHEGVTPDLLCIGKALGGGLPISACIGSEPAMQAWGDPSGEAIHTGTFFGHPAASAAALATLAVLETEQLPARAQRVGARWMNELREQLRHTACVREVRGAGLAIGIELEGPGSALRAVREMLHLGYLALPAGPQADVLQLSPPLTIDDALVDAATAAIVRALAPTPARRPGPQR